MFPYKNVLVAIDYSELTDVIFKKLESIHKDSDTNIILLHVVERDMPTLMGASQNAAISYSREWSTEEIRLKVDAENKLKKEAHKYDIGNVTCIAEVGVPRFSILFAAKEIAVSADLIIVGAHGAHGIKKLIGSTAQSILNNATCDVLAVRKT